MGKAWFFTGFKVILSSLEDLLAPRVCWSEFFPPKKIYVKMCTYVYLTEFCKQTADLPIKSDPFLKRCLTEDSGV